MSRPVAPLVILAALAVSALAGCDRAEPPVPTPPRDPQVAQALNDPLMTDPDLSAGNEAGAALRVESDFSRPVLPATPEAIARARADAAVLAGGSDALAPLPAPSEAVAALAPEAGAAAHLALLPGGPCLAALSQTAMWAAKLPAVMPVYPRGATQSAAGADGSACRVRQVTFATPVPADDVMAFYASRARAARAAWTYRRGGSDLVLAGAGSGITFDVRARAVGDHTIVRLATRER